MEKLNCEAYEVDLGHNCVVVDQIDEEHITNVFERIVDEAFGECLGTAEVDQLGDAFNDIQIAAE